MAEETAVPGLLHIVFDPLLILRTVISFPLRDRKDAKVRIYLTVDSFLYMIRIIKTSSV